MSQHLVDSKEHFVGLLSRTPAKEHADLAKQYGWRIVDLKCPCGKEVKGHVVDTRSTVADDLRVKSCPHCGAKGQYKHVEVEAGVVSGSVEAKPAKAKPAKE